MNFDQQPTTENRHSKQLHHQRVTAEPERAYSSAHPAQPGIEPLGFFYFFSWRELYRTLHRRAKLISPYIKILVELDADLHPGQVLEIARFPWPSSCTLGQSWQELRSRLTA